MIKEAGKTAEFASTKKELANPARLSWKLLVVRVTGSCGRISTRSRSSCAALDRRSSSEFTMTLPGLSTPGTSPVSSPGEASSGARSWTSLVPDGETLFFPLVGAAFSAGRVRCFLFPETCAGGREGIGGWVM